MSFSKFVDMSLSSASRFVKRYFQTVRSIEPEVASGLLQGINFENFNFPKSNKVKTFPGTRKEVRVAEILEEVNVVDGLPLSPSHIEHLVGRATKGKIYNNHVLSQQDGGSRVKVASGSGSCDQDVFQNLSQNQEKYEVGGIDIANKTQLILQSPHPVRYVIERELSTSQQGFRLRIPSYHTWILLFGRSLVPHFKARLNPEDNYDNLLNYIGNASDSGMFSADIHNTLIDIPQDHPAFKNNKSSQFHMGNKYAVLVGDYFAIRCIHFAERTKRNSVMVAITEGVEEYTTCSFGTNLFDTNVGYPILLSPTASIHDWIVYTEKAFGYLKGGLYAAFSLQHKRNPNPNEGVSTAEKNMAKFVGNLSVFLKAAQELEALENTDSVVPSPFLLSSLPAIFCQLENPHVFSHLRKINYELNPDHIRELQSVIRRSSASKRTRNLIFSFADETKLALRHVAKDQYYIYILDSLIDAVTEGI